MTIFLLFLCGSVPLPVLLLRPHPAAPSVLYEESQHSLFILLHCNIILVDHFHCGAYWKNLTKHLNLIILKFFIAPHTWSISLNSLFVFFFGSARLLSQGTD